MRKLLLGIALLATVATGCKKEETTTPVNNNGGAGGGSNNNKTGDVLLVNNSENAYVITIHGDGFVPTIAGKSSQTVTLAVGGYPFVATEKEGYTGSPTVIRETVEIKSGSTATFTIP